MSDSTIPSVGVIGGSGLYEIEGLQVTEEREMETPFGPPSDRLIGGQLEGRTVWFLPRHGRKHTLLPTEIEHRANVWALRSLGVRWVIGVGAVGSLKDDYAPTHVVIPDQYFDRTSQRRKHTFFGQGIVAHLSFGSPTAPALGALLHETAGELGCQSHLGGVYVNMDGPAFSTRAESEVNRSFGFDVIGMTNLPEAKLCREAEIAYASLCFVTDYDCWKEQDVEVSEILQYLSRNSHNAKGLLKKVIPRIPLNADWPEHRSLEGAIFTPREAWPEETFTRLRPLLDRF